MLNISKIPTFSPMRRRRQSSNMNKHQLLFLKMSTNLNNIALRATHIIFPSAFNFQATQRAKSTIRHLNSGNIVIILCRVAEMNDPKQERKKWLCVAVAVYMQRECLSFVFFYERFFELFFLNRWYYSVWSV